MTAAVEEKKSTIHALSHEGDTKLMWSKDNRDEVAAAEKMFNELRNEKKFLAYSVKGNGEPGQVIQRFDPHAEAIIMKPQLVGG